MISYLGWLGQKQKISLTSCFSYVFFCFLFFFFFLTGEGGKDKERLEYWLSEVLVSERDLDDPEVLKVSSELDS